MGDRSPFTERRWGRFLARAILMVLVPVAAVLGGASWYAYDGRYVTTENAYVKSRILAVSADIDGRVVAVNVRENQAIVAGDVLFELDPNPYRIALKLAEARMRAVRDEIEGRRAEYRQIGAEIAEVREKVKYYETTTARQQALSMRGVSSRARLDEAEFQLATARQTVRVLEQKINRVLTGLGGDPDQVVADNPLYQQAMADRDMAAYNLGRAVVAAPAAGVVTRLSLEPGEWLEAGKPAFGIIATGETWIEANLKETQLAHVTVGQPVDIQLDAYPEFRWRAVVASISPATGAEFSVLPPQNSSGNWVKVVQRLPVRLDIQPAPGLPPLRAGMTATVAIDVGRERNLFADVRQALSPVLDFAAALVFPDPVLAGGSK